jgi:4-hydroxy-2-oxoheptanedioate aldolase
MLGLKIENKHALVNAELTTQVPGIAFAEWGPGDMAMSFGYQKVQRDPLPPELQEARDRIFSACKAAGVAFLEGMTPETAAQKIDEGVRISSGGPNGEATAKAGREHAKRTMPV